MMVAASSRPTKSPPQTARDRIHTFIYKALLCAVSRAQYLARQSYGRGKVPAMSLKSYRARQGWAERGKTAGALKIANLKSICEDVRRFTHDDALRAGKE